MRKSCKLKYTARWFICLWLIFMITIDEFSESIVIGSNCLSRSVVISESLNDVETNHEGVDNIIEENGLHDKLSKSIFLSQYILKLLDEEKVEICWCNNRTHLEEIHGR